LEILAFGEVHEPVLSSAVYAIISLTAVATIGALRLRAHNAVSFSDITLLTIIMHSSGGLDSGLGLMLVVAIAGASLMLGKRLTIFYASLATIAVLLEHSWSWLIGVSAGENDMMQGFPQVGLFGIGLYATAFFGYLLATRLRATEELAQRRGVDVANLTQLNELVIQRMQSGVVICDPQGGIRLINQSALKYLGIHNEADKKSSLNEISPDLAIQLFQWLGNSAVNRGRKVFTSPVGYTLLPRFVSLGDKNAVKLIFLEDMAILKQQAQQLKMAALARLTASIAHEIRNPLGALTNAAQLLGETMDTDNAEEKRLVKIIEEQSKRMNVIVQNVTQLSRRDRINPVQLELDSWLEDFLRQYSETVSVPREHLSLMTSMILKYAWTRISFTKSSQSVSERVAPQSALMAPLIRFQGAGTARPPIVDVIDWGELSDVRTIFRSSSPPPRAPRAVHRARIVQYGASLNYYPCGGRQPFRYLCARKTARTRRYEQSKARF
jgi:two-component system sensor histidine kinase PilS (NtrC family)